MVARPPTANIYKKRQFRPGMASVARRRHSSTDIPTSTPVLDSKRCKRDPSSPVSLLPSETERKMPPQVDAVPILRLADNKKMQKVERIIQGIKLNQDTIKRIKNVFLDEMEKGLSGKKSSLQMANTYIPELPDGSEEGEYLALDLGGTNFRVCLLGYNKGRVVSEELKHYHVPENLRLGVGTKLFDFLADCVHEFLKEKGKLNRKLPLGFTFSFPMEHKGINVAILVSWTKSFNCPGVVGEDVVNMLNDAIKRRGDLQVEVVSCLNDTSGTLVQGAFLDPKCAAGLILGTGSNACYIEKAENIHTWSGDRKNIKEVIIDIEWGAFGDNGVLDFIKTDFDREVDNKSLLVNSFTFEKYIGGKYLGEIVRVILVKLTQEGLLFDGMISDKLLQHGSFNTRCVSLVEEDSIKNDSENIRTIFQDLDVSYDDDDIAITKYVCSVVSDRAALLVSVCLSVLLNRMGRKDATIAVDGSLFKLHPRLKYLMNKYIGEMTTDKKFKLLLAEDGSGKGAGLVAAIATKLQSQQNGVKA